MVSEEQTRKMVKELTRSGWASQRTVGSHSWWTCSTGKHGLSVADGHRTLSPGMVSKVRKAIAGCDCTKGNR